MRVVILLAGALAVSACGHNGQSETTQNINENLTAESIVSNDVTAIDAVTGDAANMAADVDMNYGNLTENSVEANDVLTRPAPKKAAPKAVAPKAEPAANAATNAE